MRALAALLLFSLSPVAPAQQTSGDLVTLKVQGNVYLITGAGGNITNRGARRSGGRYRISGHERLGCGGHPKIIRQADSVHY
jgi:hypothetical protein